MKNLLDEGLIGLADAAQRLGIDRETVGDYIRRGVNGVRLEAVRIGCRWKTSRPACDRFAAVLTARAGCPAVTLPTETQRRREVDAAVEYLKEHGVL